MFNWLSNLKNLDFKSQNCLSHKKSFFSIIFDDVIACKLRFSPPHPNPKSWLRLCIKQCAIGITNTSCCIFSIVDASSRAVAYNIAKYKAAKYTLHCFQSKLLWYRSMEWNMEENFSMEWKIFSMEWKWNGRKLPVWNMKKSSSIPFHTMPCLLTCLYECVAVLRKRNVSLQNRTGTSLVIVTKNNT